ncbi:MAG: ABC transporter substrate-binding protein [Planctomycetaceae bacterium]|nr:ABC transporter substrate-binding protein [Planctomycetaceae bacterium]
MRKISWFAGVAFIVVLVGLIYLINSRQAPSKSEYKVGVFQVVRHPVLDEMAASFQRGLTSRYPEQVKFDLRISDGDAAKTEQIAQSFASGNFDLVFVIGTNQAQSLVKKTTTVPIVLGGATDPLAAGLVDSWERPGKNVTGTSDLSPVGAQLDSLKEILPDANRVGIIYNPSEDNSKAILAHFGRACADKNLEPVSVPVSGANELRPTLIAVVGKIDVLYAPTDATVQAAFPSLIKTANEVNLPVFNCDEGTVQKGAIFSIGFNYGDLGTTSADMAAAILDGKEKPSDMPIRLVGKSTLYFNVEQIKRFGLTVPERWQKDGKGITR